MSQQIEGPARYQKPEESGMPHAQPTAQAMTALLRNAASVDAQKTKSLCCVAAGITALTRSATEACIPHEKLREAATPGATLNAQEHPPAQPVVGYRPSPHSDERAEYEKEFPTPEGLQYCANRNTDIRAAGSSPSGTFIHEHYAYRAEFVASLKRAWKSPVLDVLRLSHISLAMNTGQERS